MVSSRDYYFMKADSSTSGVNFHILFCVMCQCGRTCLTRHDLTPTLQIKGVT